MKKTYIELKYIDGSKCEFPVNKYKIEGHALCFKPSDARDDKTIIVPMDKIDYAEVSNYEY